jgi:hypothetical protein
MHHQTHCAITRTQSASRLGGEKSVAEWLANLNYMVRWKFYFRARSAARIALNIHSKYEVNISSDSAVCCLAIHAV